MKKIASVTAAIILAVAMTAAPVQNAGVFSTALTAQAYSGYGTYGKYTYVYDESGVTITGYTEDVEELNIPDEIDGMPVTAISDDAFGGWFHCSLKKVTLPDSVRSIGNCAFEDCLALEEINTKSVASFGDRAFHGCASLEMVELGDFFEHFGDRALSGCMQCSMALIEGNRYFKLVDGCLFSCDGTKVYHAAAGLKTVELPDSVTTIAPGAFEGCYKLTKATIPESVTAIGEYAFYECNQLSSVNLPKGLKRLENYTFCICQSLTSIELPEGLEYIGREVFTDDYQMKSVKIPASVKEIGCYSFGYTYYDGDSCMRMNDFVVNCVLGSAGDKYASDNGLKCKYYGTTDISKAKVTVSDKFYTGKALKPAATVKLGWKKLISGTDYKVSYKNNKNVGKATVTVTGKGCCTGKTSGTFVIKPGKEKLTSFNSPAKKSVKAKWVRDKQATGYQLRLATNKAFTKGSKTVWIKKNSATARTIKGLKSGKTYYFRLRAYKVMDGKKYYGKYSNIKKVKVK